MRDHLWVCVLVLGLRTLAGSDSWLLAGTEFKFGTLEIPVVGW
jgi:hypothetical protein